jgi:hypothetical protein
MKMLLLLALFFFEFIMVSCKKNSAPPAHQSTNVDTSGADTAYYYLFQLDSNALSAENAFINGYSIYGFGSNTDVGSSIIPSSDLGVNNCCTNYLPWDTTAFYETIGGINNNADSGATLAKFYSQLSATTSFKYGTDETNGVIIRWIDPQGKPWSTNFASALQTGSNFMITASKIETPALSLRITASFNCKLYDSTGNVKTLTNGKSRLSFVSGLTQ